MVLYAPVWECENLGLAGVLLRAGWGHGCGILPIRCTGQSLEADMQVSDHVQNQEPVNFGADEYDSARIRASATTLSELIDGLNGRRRARSSRSVLYKPNVPGCRVVDQPLVSSAQSHMHLSCKI